MFAQTFQKSENWENKHVIYPPPLTPDAGKAHASRQAHARTQNEALIV